MNKILLNEQLTKWLLLKRRHNVHHGLLKSNRICRLANQIWKRFTSINSRMAQEIYGTVFDEGRNGTTKNIRGKHRSFKKSSAVLMCFVQLMVPTWNILNMARKKLGYTRVV